VTSGTGDLGESGESPNLPPSTRLSPGRPGEGAGSLACDRARDRAPARARARGSELATAPGTDHPDGGGFARRVYARRALRMREAPPDEMNMNMHRGFVAAAAGAGG
jgi:hypothetical protein